MIKTKRAAKKTRKAFSDDVIAAIDKSSYLKIRAGSTHRFIAIWSVVVGNRVFIRSWYMRPTGWYYALLDEPRGAIDIAGRQIAVRAARVRSEGVKDAVSSAYAAKYVTPASIKYVKGFARGRRRDTTTELTPN
ncbi:MAG: DUF2255 family protein [Gemmatimonadaceae bacterium]